MSGRLVDHLSPDALWQQLADIVRDEIRAGTLKPGSALPSETILMETHGLSRGTVRRSLTYLAQEGYIVALPGRSWSVTAAPPKG